jgi:serine protease
MSRHLCRKAFNRSSENLAVTSIWILIFALALTSLTSSSVGATSSSLTFTISPEAYSSTMFQVKFRQDLKEQSINDLLTLSLKTSIAAITPLFGLPEQELTTLTATGEARSAQKLPDLHLWFVITLKPGIDSISFMENMKSLSSVEVVEPAPLPHPLPAITPALTESQGYLYAAPDGINASYSWSIPGGNGTGIKIYDLEYSWNQTHEDLSKARWVPLLLSPGDIAIDPFNEYNHGTAVLGELIADNDTKGVTGISWGANIGLVPVSTANMGYNPANAILLAVADGSPGDVILIEQQMTVCGLEFGDFGPSEWITSVFDAIQVATANGFVVVEAAGNGGIDLDQSGCDNIFNRSVRDSGAIIVGGGLHPGSGRDREHVASSYGSRVDLQGWAGGVMTTGYGSFYWNVDDPNNPDFWYTDYFNSTSSASAMVAGAVANLQGIALKTFGRPLTPFEIRTLLVRTGSPQLGNTDEHIGPRPDLFEAIANLNNKPVTIDIKPDSSTNHVNPRSRGRIRVAILSAPDLNALTMIDTNSLTFGRTGEEDSLVHCKQRGRDVNHDGLRDLICEFSIQATGFQKGDSVGFLEGMTVEGVPISGQDFVMVGNASDED